MNATSMPSIFNRGRQNPKPCSQIHHLIPRHNLMRRHYDSVATTNWFVAIDRSLHSIVSYLILGPDHFVTFAVILHNGGWLRASTRGGAGGWLPILSVGASSTPRAQRLEVGAPLALALAALLAIAAALRPPMVGLLVFGLITPTQPTTLTILSPNVYGGL